MVAPSLKVLQIPHLRNIGISSFDTSFIRLLCLGHGLSSFFVRTAAKVLSFSLLLFRS